MSTVCKSCGAEIVWAVTAKGKRTPVDAERHPDGTIVLVHLRVGEPPVARVTTKAEREELRLELARRAEHTGEERELRLFRSHFATCPDADRHRR